MTEADESPLVELPSQEEIEKALRDLPPVELTEEEQKRLDAFATPVTWRTLMTVLD